MTFNLLSHNSLIQTGLQSIYYGPTNKGNNLDRLYGINIDPKLFNPNTYVSHIKTHHLGVIALPLNIAPSHNNITRSIHTYRRRHRNQHKACLDYLSSSSFNLTYDNITESVHSFYIKVKSIFNNFYSLKFYPFLYFFNFLSRFVHFVGSMPTLMTDNILFSYSSMLSFLD